MAKKRINVNHPFATLIPYQTIIGIDPGEKHTGVACIQTNRGNIISPWSAVIKTPSDESVSSPIDTLIEKIFKYISENAPASIQLIMVEGYNRRFNVNDILTHQVEAKINEYLIKSDYTFSFVMPRTARLLLLDNSVAKTEDVYEWIQRDILGKSSKGSNHITDATATALFGAFSIGCLAGTPSIPLDENAEMIVKAYNLAYSRIKRLSDLCKQAGVPNAILEYYVDEQLKISFTE